eukprot:6730020-Karenia_brevis.AAC.1
MKRRQKCLCTNRSRHCVFRLQVLGHPHLPGEYIVMLFTRTVPDVALVMMLYNIFQSRLSECAFFRHVGQ